MIIADAVQNGMAGEYRTITEALVLVVTIFAWATAIDWLDFRFPRLRLAAAKEILIVRDGKILAANLARERVTEDELLSQLRLHGQDSPEGVERAYIEGDGHVSVILRDRKMKQPTGR